MRLDIFVKLKYKIRSVILPLSILRYINSRTTLTLTIWH